MKQIMSVVCNKVREDKKTQATAAAKTRDQSEIEKLVKKAAAGNFKAFGELYSIYLDRIYRYIFYQDNDKMTAEDITEEVFIKAWKAIGSCKGREKTFTSWLYRIAHNLVANWLRDRSRHPVISLDQLVPTGRRDTIAIEHQAEANDEREALLEAIRRLHPDRQQLLILKLMEGMSNVDIGRVLGRSEGAIKSLYFRTLIALREDLEKRGF